MAGEAPVYVESSLPGTPADRAAWARRVGWALEVPDRAETDWTVLGASGVEVPVVQAWRLHEASPVAAAEEERREAARVVRAAIARAVEVGARLVVVVAGFGPGGVSDPVATAERFFCELAESARAAGVRLGIEPLSRRRSPDVASEEVAELLARLDPDVFGTVVDTGHLLDEGRDPAAWLAAWPHAVDLVQLKGPGSTAPRDEDELVRRLEALGERRPRIGVEHRERLAAGEVERVRACVEAALRRTGR